MPWLRPADNHALDAGAYRLRVLSPALQRLAGVTTESRYFGFVGGQDPQQWLLRSADAG
jgi:hypothetical protein